MFDTSRIVQLEQQRTMVIIMTTLVIKGYFNFILILVIIFLIFFAFVFAF